MVRSMENQSPRHTLESFDDALRSLRDNVLMMASLTERLLAAAGHALFARDFEAGAGVIADDDEIDTLEKSVDEQGVSVLVRFQPLANDLREVVAAMKVGNNLERVADQAVAIARRAQRINESPALTETAGLEPMFRLAADILHDSVRSFADRNETLARGLKARDRELDAQHHAVIDRLTARMAAQPARIRDYLDLVLIARNIERVGDHATNIAEDAVFVTSAEDIRHTAAPVRG